MYIWGILEGRDHQIPMGRPQFETSPKMNIVGLIIRLTIALWSTGKSVVMDRGFCVIKGLFEMRKRGHYNILFIKRGNIGLLGLIEIILRSTSGQKYWLCRMSKW